MAVRGIGDQPEVAWVAESLQLPVPHNTMRGLLEALGTALARKTVDKKTGDVTLACEGFNQKNHYGRETPCDFLLSTSAQKFDDVFSLDQAATFWSQSIDFIRASTFARSFRVNFHRKGLAALS